jgi:hypothetical protein
MVVLLADEENYSAFEIKIHRIINYVFYSSSSSSPTSLHHQLHQHERSLI